MPNDTPPADSQPRAPGSTPHGAEQAKRRAARQAAALRENLKRRKAQARARDGEPPKPKEGA
jgi:hypothetical protein